MSSSRSRAISARPLYDGALAEVRAGDRQAISRDGRVLNYDALLVAVGGRPGIGLPGAVSITEPDFAERFKGVLAELEDGRIKKLVFAVPAGPAWVLPLYELALLTSQLVSDRGLAVQLALVTPESRPLELLGSAASAEVQRLLDEREIELHTGRYPASVEEDGLVLVPNYRHRLAADRVVSKPRLTGPRLRGLSADRAGFVPTDVHARVPDAPGVFAAGDATTFPVKQGGIATQQADAAAEAIAALAGADVDPQPFRPVLRGALLIGGQLRFMRSEVTGGHGDREGVAESTLWWPPSKIAGRYLSPYLGVRHGDLEVRTGRCDASRGQPRAFGRRRFRRTSSVTPHRPCGAPAARH